MVRKERLSETEGRVDLQPKGDWSVVKGTGEEEDSDFIIHDNNRGDQNNVERTTDIVDSKQLVVTGETKVGSQNDDEGGGARKDDDRDGQPLDSHDYDGEPLEDDDVDGESLGDDADGEPLEDDDVDGEPLDEDFDSEPLGEDDCAGGEDTLPSRK